MEPPRCSLQSFIKRVQGELRFLKGDRAREIVDFSIINESDWQNYEAKIQGPNDTPYENEYPTTKYKSYPFVPPNIIFKTKLFHPNISSKGDICLDNFHNGWNPGCTLEKVLLSICVLLSEPNPNDFLVPEAAFLYKENRKEYDRKAREWTREYAMENSIAVNVHQLKELMDTVNRMSVSSSSSSGHTAQQEAIDIQPSRRRRTGRFNSIETLQVKTFDNGESKEYVPIITQCLRSRDDRQEKDRYQPYVLHDTTEKLDTNNEIQSLITAVEREGIKLGKQTESKVLISKLYTLLDSTPDIVGQGCLHLYSMQTFLYPELNQFLREADETKINTYGSFVRLLCFYFNHQSAIEIHSIEVYRGMNLSSMMIDTYKKAAKSSTSFRWAGFSSTSKSRHFDEDFNTNILFIMQLKKIYSKEKKAIDISLYSQFPEEEEVLLKAGVEFTVEKVEYHNENKRHYIYLNVYV